MTFIYPAVFTRKDDGTGYEASFPDLEMCRVTGRDLEETADNARDAAKAWIELEMEDGGELPEASCPEDLEAEGQEVHQIMVHIKLLPDSE